MMVCELDDTQRRAVEAPLDACVAIVGPAASGKTTALRERIARAAQLHPDAEPLIATDPDALGRFALCVLRERAPNARLIDDADACEAFATVCAPLFSLAWDDLAAGRIDAEVPGLRSPERFADAAFRLIRKLRDAAISPEEFLARSLAGATAFYAKPPNLADPKLLLATKAVYHDSLAASPGELMRQHRYEVDLAKVLARLYADYAALVESSERMTAADAVLAAIARVEGDPALAARLRERHRFAFVDAAECRSAAELRLLQSIFGTHLPGVTFCGDPESAFGEPRGLRPGEPFTLATVQEALPARLRSPRILVHRAATPANEAAFIARQVRAWIDAGVAPRDIAVVFRSVDRVEPYEAALLDAGIPAIVAGDANVWRDRRALDALALLWNVHDPFRHDWMLRTLASPALGLSDASLAALCAEPAHPQTPLFAFDNLPAPTVRASRWDPKRDLRLGWNIVRGEQDDALAPPARERLVRFRLARERWLALASAAPFEDFARTVWREGLAREGDPGSPRALAQQTVLRRLLSRLTALAAASPGATLGDLLDEAARRRRSDAQRCDDDTDEDAVRVLSCDAARGRTFARMAIAQACAGSFPRWYAPDAFLFSPALGMVPKDNVGDARASRTAKYSYYVYRVGAQQSFNARERRAFDDALRRARDLVLVTASGVPTKGATTPEFLEELRRRPGVETIA